MHSLSQQCLISPVLTRPLLYTGSPVTFCSAPSPANPESVPAISLVTFLRHLFLSPSLLFPHLSADGQETPLLFHSTLRESDCSLVAVSGAGYALLVNVGVDCVRLLKCSGV